MVLVSFRCVCEVNAARLPRVPAARLFGDEQVFAYHGRVMEPLQQTLLGGGEPRIDERAVFERVELDDLSWVEVARSWLAGGDTLLDALIASVPWTQGRRWMYERMVDDPRVSAWYRTGDELPHPVLDDVRRTLSRHYGVPLRAIGLNFYRDGRDSVAWHSDRELKYLDRTLIAILTLGGPRPFLLRPRGGGKSRDLRPGSGDLLVMRGRCQADWEHCVPKVRAAPPRMSISLRWASHEGLPTDHPRVRKTRQAVP
jgi:alkylated DNA repair dioxygenase AlkB